MIDLDVTSTELRQAATGSWRHDEYAIWSIPGPFRPSPRFQEWIQREIEPIIAATLPGYGRSDVPLECILGGDESYLVLDRFGHLSAFAAFRCVNAASLRGHYLTLAAVLPSAQGRGILQNILARSTVAVDFVSATTNVPAIYQSLSNLSGQLLGSDSYIAPQLADLTSYSPSFREFIRTVVSRATRQSMTQIEVDEQLVRRGYRERDLQQPDGCAPDVPTWVPSSTGALSQFFLRDLRLAAGDAVVVFAAASLKCIAALATVDEW